MIFSTYPTVMNAIDEKKNKYGEKLFSPGHFQLIICDEVHRSIYKKYQEIFEYFDAMLLGMTATPKNEIDKNTYGIFDLERGVPTFAYELEKAVEEGYLVNYSTLEYKTKIMEDGIHYDDLTDEEKDEYEETFESDDMVGDDISSSAINSWLFNTDTIIDSTEGEPIYGGNDLKNYRKKVEFYLKEHSDRLSVYKLRNNKKLSEADLKELERILWTEIGSKDDYIKEYGDTPIGRLVRQIVGVDKAAVNEAFSEFLTEERLNLNQMRFVNLIVDYIAANGNIDDNKVLMGEPFKSVGSITSLFKDDMGTAKQIMEVVTQIKRNSEEIA